jgi:hypothetical protein
MTQQSLHSASLNPPPITAQYRFGCWFAGVVMIAAAMRSSRSQS